MGDRPVARLLPAHRTTQTQDKRTQTSMPRMGFQPTIPVFERTKRVRTLDRAANVIGTFIVYTSIFGTFSVRRKLIMKGFLTSSRTHI
jgi:hypothetical protein